MLNTVNKARLDIGNVSTGAAPLVVILGAGEPHHGRSPSAITRTFEDKRVLDWIIEAFSRVPGAVFQFIGGYRVDAVISRYSNLDYAINPDWESTGAVASLALAMSRPVEDLYVCYSDTLFRREVVEMLSAAGEDVVYGIDHSWRERYAQRAADDLAEAETVRLNELGDLVPENASDSSASTVEFTGLVRLRGRALSIFKAMCSSDERIFKNWPLSKLLFYLSESPSPPSMRSIDLGAGWAELNAPQDLAQFILGTKAETLERLRPLLRSARIEDQVTFSVSNWEHSRATCVSEIADLFDGDAVIVRSSALSEDCWNSSNAGGYDSVMDVPSACISKVEEAVDKVVASYSDSNPLNQILVQRMLSGVTLSGVVFTRTLDQGAPYYVVNYDDETESTDSVTGGHGQSLRTVLIGRARHGESGEIDDRLESLLIAVREVEDLVGYDSLDIEFARTTDGMIHILQVRPIAVTHGFHQIEDDEINTAIVEAKEQFERLQSPSPRLAGSRTILAVMPDWNPAEIIGTKPRQLALSLYQYLITDEIWALQRAEYGYRDVRPQPLIVALQGHPFVDVRASFNSFVPSSVDDGLRARLIEYYLDELRLNPHFHDKVEFEVLFTCWYPDLRDQMNSRLGSSGFSKSELDLLESALISVTAGGFSRIDTDYDSIRTLESRYKDASESGMAPLELACHLIEDCKRFGTLAFSHLARAGFVAATMLKSFVRTGSISERQFGEFMSSLGTVTTDFEVDALRVASNEMKLDDFVEKYGHLRPGTYDITSEAYHENPEKYLAPIIESSRRERESDHPFQWGDRSRTSITATLNDAGFQMDVDGFESFARKAIEGREWAKFVFTRSLSKALDTMRSWFCERGFDRDAVSFLHFHDVLQLRSGAAIGSIAAWVDERVARGRDAYRLTRAIEFPPILCTERDLELFERPSSEPNFVTSRSVVAEVRILSGDDGNDVLADRIILIPQADPGFDWIFGASIAGLITMYGGANSHMAIRAAELGLPAAIGVGEKLFERLKTAEIVELNCAGKTIRVSR